MDFEGPGVQPYWTGESAKHDRSHGKKLAQPLLANKGEQHPDRPADDSGNGSYQESGNNTVLATAE